MNPRQQVLIALVSSLLVSNARAETEQVPREGSVVFQHPKEGDPGNAEGTASTSTSASGQLQLGFGGSLVFQDPRGDYQSDHGNESALGFSLQMPIRESKQWTFLPTITRTYSNPGQYLDHETTSFGVDVHWRGWNPGAAYLLLGGGMAEAKMTKTQCVGGVLLSCDTQTTPLGSKNAPYLQVGLGLVLEFERKSGCPFVGGGPFIEVRLWRGPYMQTDGTPVGSQGKTGNALFVAVGGRFLWRWKS